MRPRPIMGHRCVGMLMAGCAPGEETFTVEPRPSWVGRLLLSATRWRSVNVEWTYGISPNEWTSKFRRKLVESSRGGNVQACSEMIDHVSPQRGFYEPFFGASPGMMGCEDLKREEAIAEMETAGLGNEYWLPGA